MISSSRIATSLVPTIILFCLLGASEGQAALQRQAATTLNFPAELPSAEGYTTVNAIPIAGVQAGMTFNSPICTCFPAGETNRLYVVLRAGTIRVVPDLSAAVPTHNLFMDLAGYLNGLGQLLPSNDEYGLFSMVFHPNYNQNGYFYLFYTVRYGGSEYHQRLARFQATGTPGNYNAATSANPATQTPILTIFDEAFNHNGGDLAFGADGYLYLSLGDEGGSGDTHNNARFINKDFWGQMIRLDVDNRPENLLPHAHSQASTSHPSAVHPGTYRVPADNPFIGATTWHGQTFAASTVRTEIYATGLRNPFRFTIDAPTGRIFLGDVGQFDWEEVDIIVKGGDYGWSWREGLHPFWTSPTNPPRFPDNTAGNTNQPPATGFTPIDPIFEYISNNTANVGEIFGATVCGGMVYRGNQLTELQGAYIFSDLFGGGGIVAALRETSPGVWTAERLTLRPQIIDYGIDPRDGEPLLCSLAGTIWKLSRDGTSGEEPKALLSETGAFSNLASLTPSAGMIPYDPNVNFWSDHAIKSRWFGIRNLNDVVNFSATGNWTLPTGMVWMKHFDIETTRGNPATRRKLETRFLVKTVSGIYGLSYKWRPDQSDADLVAEQGLTEAIAGSNPAQTWRFPSRGECVNCHTSNGGYALSFNTPQLNRTRTYGGDVQNQIFALSDAGYLAQEVESVAELPAFAAAADTSQSLEWRVRSYLAVNCVQCHQPGGPSQGAWDARHTTPTDLANLINGTLLNDAGDTANRFAVPGDAAHSMLLRRQQGNGVSRMPPLGTLERDLVNEQLVANWIAALPSRQSLTQWQTTHFGSSGAPAAQPTFDADGDGRSNALEYLTGTLPTVAGSAWSYGQTTVVGGNMEIQFTQPANRAAIVEVSSDLAGWTPWNVTGNGPSFPATDMPRTIVAPTTGLERFFRVRFTAP